MKKIKGIQIGIEVRQRSCMSPLLVNIHSENLMVDDSNGKT